MNNYSIKTDRGEVAYIIARLDGVDVVYTDGDVSHSNYGENDNRLLLYACAKLLNMNNTARYFIRREMNTNNYVVFHGNRIVYAGTFEACRAYVAA